MRRSLLAMLGAGLLLSSSPSIAQEAPAPRSLSALCRALRADEGGERTSRCRVERTARSGRLQVAVLRVTVLDGNSPDSLVIAVRERAGWRRVGSLAPPVYSGHGMLGAVELDELVVAQRIAGGAPEIDATARSWQGEPEGECVRGVEETHRTVCSQIDGAWRCLEVQTASEDERVQPGPLGEPGAVCPTARELPGWSVAMDFSEEGVTLREVRGPLPEAMTARLGTRSVREAFSGGGDTGRSP